MVEDFLGDTSLWPMSAAAPQEGTRKRKRKRQGDSDARKPRFASPRFLTRTTMDRTSTTVLFYFNTLQT
jgi:hypothetical protein